MADTDRRPEAQPCEACAPSSRENSIPEQGTARTPRIELQQRWQQPQSDMHIYADGSRVDQATAQETTNDHDRQMIPTSTLLNLYTSHLLSTWNSRLFEFGAVLFLASIYPGTLLPLSIYALTRSAAAILLGQAVGTWIDRGSRIAVVRASIIGQRVAVAASCVLFWKLEVQRLLPGNGSLRQGLFALVILLACVEKLCSVMNLVAVERDWVVVITEGNEPARRTVNARMRRIDLFCKLVGPLAVSLIAIPSILIAVWATLAMSIASVTIEYYCISKVYKSFPALRRMTNTTDVAPHAVDNESSVPSAAERPMIYLLRSRTLRLLPLQSLRLYFRHRAFVPSFALSLLYLTVLSFSGQMITYLIAVGYTSLWVGVARTVSTVFELSATWIAPRLMGRIGVVRTGIWSISWQMCWLTAGLTWFLAHLHDKNASSVAAATGLAVSIALSRVGLWGYDLSAQTIIQDAVDPDSRGKFSMVEAAFQNLFELLAYATTIIFPRPDQFRWAIIISAAATYSAGGLYAFYVRKTRGHLLHAPPSTPRSLVSWRAALPSVQTGLHALSKDLCTRDVQQTWHQVKGRRIRCLLPDTTIQPSPQPQPADKACARCSQNNFDCIVDSTTLGRPAQKRMRSDEALARQVSRTSEQVCQEQDELAELASLEVEDFLLSQPETEVEQRTRGVQPSRSEISEVVLTPYHLFSALLSRDSQFASLLSSPPHAAPDILDLVSHDTATVLDACLIWHRLYNPGIPRLLVLREDVASTDHGQPQRLATLFLFALLCDLALDVPTARLAPYRHLQPAVGEAARYHGQQVQFLLPRCDYTVQGLILAAEYRYQLFAYSQAAAPHAIKAVPYITSARQVASDLGYPEAGARLIEAMDTATTSSPELEIVITQAMCWVQLTLAHEQQTGMLGSPPTHNSPQSTTFSICLRALHQASTLSLLPPTALLPHALLATWAAASATVTAVRTHWRSLPSLAAHISTHAASHAAQSAHLSTALPRCLVDPAMALASLTIAENTRHSLHTYITGQALFFAIMAGALPDPT
ncbi:hypothetical protein LTR53_004826, partial [Teratosphaeriaceae sp. CCFEE 6253]